MPIHGAVCSHASRRAAAGRYFLRLSMRARRFAPNPHASLRSISPCGAARTLYVVTPPDAPRPVDNDSVSACAPGTACRASTLRCVVIFLRTGFSASYFLRLAMPVRALRALPVTARYALVSPEALFRSSSAETAPFGHARIPSAEQYSCRSSLPGGRKGAQGELVPTGIALAHFMRDCDCRSSHRD